MPFLIAAVVLVGILCVLDLILSLGVIRRLRVHSELLDKALDGSTAMPMMMPVGQLAGEFTATTDTGTTVSTNTLRGRTLVGFFLEDCAGCQQLLPEFVAAAADFPGGRGQVLAVVVFTSDEEMVTDYRRQLTSVAQVVVEGRHGGVGEAMDVRAYPAFGLLDDARLVATGREILRHRAKAGVTS
jgi:thiol-disulfide isomerase/thioredoxin